MKRVLYFIIAAIFVVTTSCNKLSPPGTYDNNHYPQMVVNGEKQAILDWRTGDEFIILPFYKTCCAFGANTASDSPYSDYGVTVFELNKKRFVLNYDEKIFMYERDYSSMYASDECSNGKYNLFPEEQRKDSNEYEYFLDWEAREVYIDSLTFSRFLNLIGITVFISYDESTRILSIDTVPCQGNKGVKGTVSVKTNS